MPKKTKHGGKADVVAKQVGWAGDELVASLARAKKASQRAIRSWVKTVEKLGGDVSVLPTTEMRKMVDATFKSAGRVLEAEHKLAIGVIDAMEKPKPRPKKKATVKPAEFEIVREEVAKVAAVS
ncbi:MAG: hypothetical protein ACXVQY_00560 [Actinomycetota bacterium]